MCSEVAYLNDGDVFLLTEDGITSTDSAMVPDFELLEGTYEEQNPGRFDHMMNCYLRHDLNLTGNKAASTAYN